MSILDKWGYIKCPKCSHKDLYVWYFSCDCRGNPSSKGSKKCEHCGYLVPEKDLSSLIRLLSGDSREPERDR